jgi:hypothetical protein
MVRERGAEGIVVEFVVGGGASCVEDCFVSVWGKKVGCKDSLRAL